MEYHILNGDALQQRFPDEIYGEQIVFRECLVSGPTGRTTLPNFWEQRLAYLQQLDPQTTAELFREKVLQEIEKITSIPATATVYCWFEEDLFCQVNFWTTIDLLTQKGTHPTNIFWVRPLPGFSFGYAGMDNQQCQYAFEKALPIDSTSLQLLAQLAQAYDQTNLERLANIAKQLPPYLEPIQKAVQWEIERHPNGGRPKTIMRNILAQKANKSFGLAFQDFVREAPEYGFGDLQVKRIYDDVQQEH